MKKKDGWIEYGRGEILMNKIKRGLDESKLLVLEEENVAPGFQERESTTHFSRNWFYLFLLKGNY